jgi:hypothetical protein
VWWLLSLKIRDPKARADVQRARMMRIKMWIYWIIEKICQEQIGIIAGAMTMD